MNSRFPQRDVSWRTGGPSVHASGDGREGAYTATLFAAPSGGTCKVVIPAVSPNWETAFCSGAFTGSPGDSVLVMFDENKTPWVVSPSGVAAQKINGVTVPLTSAAWIAPTLINSWVITGVDTPAGYFKDPLGVVHLRGRIRSGAAGTVAFVLPAGNRPGNDDTYSAAGLTASNAVSGAAIEVVASSGNVLVFYTSGVVDVGLGGITFLAEN